MKVFGSLLVTQSEALCKFYYLFFILCCNISLLLKNTGLPVGTLPFVLCGPVPIDCCTLVLVSFHSVVGIVRPCFILLLSSCLVCNFVLGFGILGLSSAASVVPRFTLGRVSDMFDLILR